MQAPWWWAKTETCRSYIYVHFNSNFNVFFFKLINVQLLVSEIYVYQNARCNDKKKTLVVFVLRVTEERTRIWTICFVFHNKALQARNSKIRRCVYQVSRKYLYLNYHHSILTHYLLLIVMFWMNLFIYAFPVCVSVRHALYLGN